METLNVSTIVKKFSDETAAYELLEGQRWWNGPECPHCGSVNRAYFIKPVNGAVDGHEILPIGGHESPRWRSRNLPTGGHQIRRKSLRSSRLPAG